MRDVKAVLSQWIGTPFLHQGASCQLGCDCLGLLRGVHNDLAGALHHVAPYPSDWVISQPDLLEKGLYAYLRPLNDQPVSLGQVLGFALRPNGGICHLGIATGRDRFIHAHRRFGVCEVALSPPWRIRLRAQFEFIE